MAVEEFPHIDGYEIDSLLGQGGMGAVYKGRRISDDRTVAIKVIRGLSEVDDCELHNRFRREIDVSKTFAHPYVTLTLDGGFSKVGDPFLVMEFIDGISLEDLIFTGALDEEMATNIGRQVCEALSYIHSRGIQHRDVKPANIIVVSPERSVLVDFGLALDDQRTRISATSAVVGTMRYLAPERLKGKKGSPASDIFSLGVTLFYAVSLEMPFNDEEFFSYVIGVTAAEELAVQASFIQHLVPKLSADFCNLLAKSMALNEKERFQTGEEFLEALDNVGKINIDDTVEIAPAPPLKQKSEKTKSLLRSLIVLLLFFVVFLIALSSKLTKKASLDRAKATKELPLVMRELLVDSEIPSTKGTLHLAKILKTISTQEYGSVSDLALGRHRLYQEALKAKNYAKAVKLFDLFLENHCAEWYSAGNRLQTEGMSQFWFYMNVGLPQAHTIALQIKKADNDKTKLAMVSFLNAILAYVCDSGKRVEFWQAAQTPRQEIEKIVKPLRESAKKAIEWQAVGECLLLLQELDESKEARAKTLILYSQYMDELEKLSDPGRFVLRGNRALLRGQTKNLDPTNASHRINLGVDRKYQLAAIAYGKMAIELSKDREQLLDLIYCLAGDLCEIGNAEEALKILEKHPLSSSDSENTQLRYYYRLSMTFLTLKRFSEARKAINRCHAFAHTESDKRRIRTSLLRINTLKILK